MKWITLALCLFIAGCGVPAGDQPSSRESGPDIRHVDTIGGYDLYRTIDRNVGVVCYVHHYGVSCLPIAETTLDVAP
jgi:hypothetical protein